jgi:Ser/Thr protein kinase RdoA (MazF antagonist)
MNQHIWGNSQTQFFFELTPEAILDSIQELGLEVTGRYFTLNSMENRVFELEVENNGKGQFVIAKFYRPGRWSKEQILEEHEFLFDLKAEEIPVIAPFKFNDQSLFLDKKTGLYYCLFPKKGGRTPQEMTNEQLEITGRLLARIHNVGSSKKAKHRLEISPEVFGIQNLNYLLDNDKIPAHLELQYQDLVEEICSLSTDLFKTTAKHRIHGDCHWGNIIERDNKISFIDFDDMLIGPAVQDIWLTVPGIDEEAIIKRNILLDAYESFREFDYQSLKLIEPLRALRFIHFSAWIAKRWDDPSFKNAFPHFGDANYWDTQIYDLTVQRNLILNGPNSGIF